MRKTSNDYAKEIKDLRTRLESSEAHIKARLIDLVEKYPDAIVLKKGIDQFKAKCVTKSWIDGLSVDTQVAYIRSIEEHSATLEKHRQVTIYD